ncbi:MAG: TetR/AcrR family transcriptional regulator [Cyclobacteriaceae bacterium]|nr:TetR/AcrR family transcriptional regulator [Cyclobacteriaceae bacterium]
MPKIIAKKQDWIKLGYRLFSEQGISGIVIEKMATKLKVNKSSFYWHFKTRNKFIEEFIKYWVFIETEQVISFTDTGKTPKEKLEKFLNITFKNNPYLEFIFYLKRYATKNKNIQKIIDSIDKSRLAYTARLFQDFGYSKKESEIKSSIFYKYLIGYHEMIRYKKQNEDYVFEVKKELKHFLNI